MDWLNAVAQGVLIGGLYALFAADQNALCDGVEQIGRAHV